MSEDQLERECLGWLGELGYTHLYEPDIAHDSSDRQHASDPEVALAPRRRLTAGTLLHLPEAEMLVEEVCP